MEKDALVRRLVDGVEWNRSTFQIMLYPEHFQVWLQSYAKQGSLKSSLGLTSLAADVRTALAASAVRRRDCEDLKKWLKAGIDPSVWSFRFGSNPLFLAAKLGSREIIAALMTFGSWRTRFPIDLLNESRLSSGSKKRK